MKDYKQWNKEWNWIKYLNWLLKYVKEKNLDGNTLLVKKIHLKLYRSLLFNYLKLRIDLHIAITTQQLRRKMKMCFFCSCAFAMLLTLLFHMSSQYYSLLLSRVFHNAASKEIIAFSPSQPSRVKLVRTGSS